MEIKKFTAEIKGVKDSGEFEAVLSMPTLDRDMEIIDAKAFEPLPDHITIDIDHMMDAKHTVGSGTPYYEGDVLKFKGSFASTPDAQEIRAKVVEGHLRKMSVAYMNSHYEVDETDGLMHLRKAELLNAAIVPIPSNRQADILVAKSAEVLKALTPQQIHDLAVSSGAACRHAEKAPVVPTEQTPKDPAATAASLPADAQVTQAKPKQRNAIAPLLAEAELLIP